MTSINVSKIKIFKNNMICVILNWIKNGFLGTGSADGIGVPPAADGRPITLLGLRPFESATISVDLFQRRWRSPL